MEPWYRVFWKVRFSESPGDGDGRLFAIEEDQRVVQREAMESEDGVQVVSVVDERTCPRLAQCVIQAGRYSKPLTDKQVGQEAK